MAQPATEPAQEPQTGPTKRSTRRARARTAEEQAAIALDLGPLLAPYRKRGRLAIRVEQMPPLARLSAGRNNGDNSWSLGSDELEALSFQPPPGFDQPHMLAIRIILHDSAGASTAAVLDYEVSPDGAGPTAPVADAALDAEAAAQLQRLQEALAEMGDRLDQRETALAAAREDAEAARMALELAREDWEKEEAKRLAEAKAGWQKEAEAALGRAQKTAEHSRAADESELRALKDELAASRTELAAREAALAEMRAAQTKTERDAEAGQREALRKAEEETRLAAAKAAWQKETEAALAEARAAANDARVGEEAEQRRVTDELTRLHKAANTRDAEMTRLRATMINAEAAAARAQRDALAKAEDRWKSEEAARLQAAETAWRAEMEAALAAARTGDADAAHREAEQRAALGAAESEWKAQSARELAALQARCEHAEAELESRAVQAAADAAELGRLQDEWRAAQDSLAERDRELERLRATAAKAAVPAPSTQAVTAIEAALEEATARYEAAEAALTDLRRRTGPRAATDMALLRDEVETLQTMLTQREEELARLRVAADRWHDYQEQEAVAGLTRTAKRKPRRYAKDDESEAPRRGGLLRDVALVVAVAVAGVLFTPKIVAALPYEWQAELPAFLQPAQDDGGDATVTAPAPAKTLAPPPAPARPMAVIIHGVNLRAELLFRRARWSRRSSAAHRSKRSASREAGTMCARLRKRSGTAVSGWVYKTYLTPGETPAKAATPKS